MSEAPPLWISERHRRAIDEGRAEYVGSHHLVPIISYKEELPMSLHPSTFEYLKPTDDQLAAMAEVRAAFKNFSEILEDRLPDGPDKTYVMRQLRDCAMWANIAITRNPDGSQRS